MDENINFDDATRIRREVEQEGKKRYKEESKIRLGKIMTTKIKTTMIGALASIESHFSFLWETEDDSTDALKMREIFEKLREEILNNGNNQMRNAMSELQQYEVEWLRYKINLPVRQPREESDG